MFIPVEEKLKKIIPDLNYRDEFEHYKSILPKMIANGHKAHQTISGYDKCKPEIEAFRWFDGINIPIHGYCDLKGDIIIEDKCKFPRKGRIKKDGTRSWTTAKLPEERPDPFHLLQVDFYWSVFEMPVYLCYINEESFKVFHADNCEELKPENIKKRIPIIIQKCKVRQNLLQISSDPQVIKNYIQPNFDTYFWRNDLDENYLKDAKKFWGY
tara:strand:- start:9 stop:644 length:636 start_codon:yes stop_codon:yes gene_type:complete